MEHVLSKIVDTGEGVGIEFKEGVSTSLAREMVAFANSCGGVIYVGIDDSGGIVGCASDNAMLSQIQDLARNCDPPIAINIVRLQEGVLAIEVLASPNKPHQCREGFFVRTGASSQKLRRDDLLALLASSGSVAFDRAINRDFHYPEDFSESRFSSLQAKLSAGAPSDPKSCLYNIDVASAGEGNVVQFSNAGVLLFAVNPQTFFPESYLTCVLYQGLDRTVIVDRHDFKGSLIDQIEAAFDFVMNSQKVAYEIGAAARRIEHYQYPPSAIREVIVNAVMHRDYLYQNSHVYLSLFPDRLEVENPGGFVRGMTNSDLGKLSVRRNPLIAQLLQRAGYVEGVGSGYNRIFSVLKENGNIKPSVEVTNFFRVILYARDVSQVSVKLTARQERLVMLLKEKGEASKRACADYLKCGDDTALRELQELISKRLVVRRGTGKASVYGLVGS